MPPRSPPSAADEGQDCLTSSVGGLNHLEKYESMGRMQPIYEMENKTCLKPPTSSDYSRKVSEDSPNDHLVTIPTII